ncbi:MAG TPA: cupin domain-containing protein [Candidatus Krumholzibacteria bacterium]|nr:cupin domain-containing protein [Candidatus Krumholzibacteria bacterium]
MIIRRLDDVQKTSVTMDGVQGVAKQLVIGSADGVPNFSFRVFTVEPGGHSPHHRHDGIEHVNYVISGRGALVDGEGALHPIAAGEFAFVAPGDVHQFRNTGDEPFVFICAVPRSYE